MHALHDRALFINMKKGECDLCQIRIRICKKMLFYVRWTAVFSNHDENFAVLTVSCNRTETPAYAVQMIPVIQET